MATYHEQIYEIVKQIPRGRISTYGAIADYLALGSARMVGWALNRCAFMDGVPAHRVLNRRGELSGRAHFSPPERMQQLLESEGVVVENDKVVDFDKIYWHPSALEET